jgi:hypothetical protein
MATLLKKYFTSTPTTSTHEEISSFQQRKSQKQNSQPKKLRKKGVSFLGSGDSMTSFKETFEFFFRNIQVEGFQGEEQFSLSTFHTNQNSVSCYKMPFYESTKNIQVSFIKKAHEFRDVE